MFTYVLSFQRLIDQVILTLKLGDMAKTFRTVPEQFLRIALCSQLDEFMGTIEALCDHTFFMKVTLLGVLF